MEKKEKEIPVSKFVTVEAIEQLHHNGKTIEAGGTLELPYTNAMILEKKKKAKILKEGK